MHSSAARQDSVVIDESSVEGLLLQSPHGYQLLDALVQANVNLASLTLEDLQRIIGRFEPAGTTTRGCAAAA